MSAKPLIISAKAAVPRRSRWGFGSLTLAVGMTVAGFLWWTVTSSEDYRHRQVRHRIEGHIRKVLNPMTEGANATERLSKADRGRCELMHAIFTALGNWSLYYPKNTVPGKLAAIADRLDATHGADLQSYEGCVQLLKLFDEASSTFREYPWVTALYEKAEEGLIPPLPKLNSR